MRTSSLSLGLWLALAVATAILAGTAEATDRNHTIDVEDYFTIGVISECALSADGARVAYVEQRWEPPREKRNQDVWVADCGSGLRQRLTFERSADHSPVWSPDGRYVYFLSNRIRPGDEQPPWDGSVQVWRVSPEGGEPQPVTRVADGVAAFQLSVDGRTLYYLVSEKHVEDEWKEQKEKHADLEYGHGVTRISQIWTLDLESWRAEKIADPKRFVRQFAVTRDQTRIAMITTPDDTLLSNEGWSRVDVYDAASGEISVVTPDAWRGDHPSPFGWVRDVAWAADGQALAFITSFDGYATRLYVVEWQEGIPRLRRLTWTGEPDVCEGALAWRGQTRELCFLGEWKARRRVYQIATSHPTEAGKPAPLTAGDVAVDSFSVNEHGTRLAGVLSSLTHPPDVYFVDLDRPKLSPLTRVTRVNPQVDTWKLPQIQIVSWAGSGGTECEGILELPPDYKPGDGPLPTIVEVHGGPTSATLFRMRFWIYGRTLMPAKGYALFSPNYRGSTGYGEQFTRELIGRENDIDVQDILKGVDALVERGIADPDRLGVMGWSNGGYLTNCLITQTDRFKAASSGAGVADMLLQWASEDTPGHVINYMQGLAWEAPDAYRKASPVFRFDRIRTPTLIHVGGADERCPPVHSRALHRALYRYLNVPVELVVYPGEGHSLTTYKNRKAKMEWDLAWFDRYLLGKTTPPTTTASEELTK